VFFFDEAHLLFDQAPKALLSRIEQIARLIRSKGIGVFFVTQNLLPYNIHTINATIRLSVFYPGDELTTVRSRSAWVPIRFEMPAELR
jgi:hypothetical protein